MAKGHLPLVEALLICVCGHNSLNMKNMSVAILAQVTHFLFTRGEGLGPGGKCVQPFCLEPLQLAFPDAMW